LYLNPHRIVLGQSLAIYPGFGQGYRKTGFVLALAYQASHILHIRNMIYIYLTFSLSALLIAF
jgi:hypothetical protein